MASTVTSVADPSAGATNIVNTNLGSTKEAPVSGTIDVIYLHIDNSANAAASYLKIWDAAAGDVTVGTTVPDWVFKVPAGEVSEVHFRRDNLKLATALCWATLTAGGTSGTTAPTSAVVVRATTITG